MSLGFCSGLTNITFPAGLTSIGNYAFRECSGLTGITIPAGVTSIESGAFQSCSSLASILFPDGLTSIGGTAFEDCKSLTSVTLSDGLTSIGPFAFSGCNSLTSILLPESLTSIENCAFSSCSGLTSITLPRNVTRIGYQAFFYCSGLTSITLPERVTTVEYMTFTGCSSLTSITLPESVTSIKYWAFYNCSGLTSIAIPGGVTSIGDHAFYECPNLTLLVYAGSYAETYAIDNQIPYAAYTQLSENGMLIASAVTGSKPSGTVAGEDFLLRVSYMQDSEKNIRLSQLRVALPPQIRPVSDTLSLNGEETALRTDDGGAVVVDISGMAAATVYLYCAAVEAGEYSIEAFVKAAGDGAEADGVSLGVYTAKVSSSTLQVPERSGVPAIRASGKTVPNSTVTIYDNGEAIGSATANAAGSWNARVELAGPLYSYSYHFIHTVTSGGSLPEGGDFSTEEQLVIYDAREGNVSLSKITMYNTGDHGAQATVFDFTSDSTVVPYYRMWPSRYPDFSFRVEFEGDNALLSGVYVVTENSAGEKTYVQTAYDPSSGTWVGSRQYHSFAEAPASVSASYEVAMAEDVSGNPFDDAWFADARAEYQKITGDVQQSLMALGERLSCTPLETDGEGAVTKARIAYADPDSGETMELFTVSVEKSPIEGNISVESLAGAGFAPCTLDDGTPAWATAAIDETGYTVTVVDPAGGYQIIERVEMHTANNNTPQLFSFHAAAGGGGGGTSWDDGESWVTSLNAWLDNWGWAVTAWDSLGVAGTLDTVRSEFLTVDGLNQKLKAQYSVLHKLMGELNRLKSWQCCDGSMKTIDYDTASLDLDIDLFYANTSRMINGLSGFYVSSILISGGVAALGAATGVGFVPGALAGMGIGGASTFAINRFVNAVNRTMDDGYSSNLTIMAGKAEQIRELVKKSMENCDCGAPDCLCHGRAKDLDASSAGNDPFKPREGGAVESEQSKPATYIADPSGFVYEAVPSNTLPGVTAVISSRDGAWNAEDYDQQNPQVTGADGAYYWDVPPGSWKVSFSLDGYVPADTSAVPSADGEGWMPVPPPQVEINVAMVSTAAPHVAQVLAYTDRVELVFSQYMDIESVSRAAALERQGEAADVSVTALEAEYNLEQTVQYATRFSIVPKDGDLSGALVLTLSQDARNYAGTALKAAFVSEIMTVIQRPTGIRGADSVSLILREPETIELCLEPGIAGRELRVENLSPVLLTAGEETLTTDAGGNASLTLTGAMPGSGMLRVYDPSSGLSKTVSVSVALKTYSVSFQPGAGAGEMAKGTATQGVAYTFPSCAFEPPEGQKFKAWSDGEALYKTGDTALLAENVTLTALYEDLTEYTVIWRDGDGSQLDKKTYREGEGEPETERTPTKAADAENTYSFTGWDSGTVDGTTKTYEPQFAATAVKKDAVIQITEASPEKGMVSVSVSGDVSEGAVLIAAAYDSDGRMTDAILIQTDGREEYLLGLELTGASRVSAFLLRSGWVPMGGLATVLLPG